MRAGDPAGGSGGRRGGIAASALGGSFNPAHGGHLHHQPEALRRLDLDEVWWLVSPQNPLKPVAGMAPFAARLRAAAAGRGAGIRASASAISKTGSAPAYTADTMRALEPPVPGHPVRLADGRRQSGADAALGALGRDLSRPCPLPCSTALPMRKGRSPVPRPSVSPAAACRNAAARRLAETKPPAWVFLHTGLDPTSATRIRAEHQTEPDATADGATNPNWPRSPRSPHARAPARGGPARRSRRKSSNLVLKTLDDGKAEDVVTIDLAGKTDDRRLHGDRQRALGAPGSRADRASRRGAARQRQDCDRGQGAGRLGADRRGRRDRPSVPARNPRLLQSRKDVGLGFPETETAPDAEAARQ